MIDIDLFKSRLKKEIEGSNLPYVVATNEIDDETVLKAEYKTALEAQFWDEMPELSILMYIVLILRDVTDCFTEFIETDVEQLYYETADFFVFLINKNRRNFIWWWLKNFFCFSQFRKKVDPRQISSSKTKTWRHNDKVKRTCGIIEFVQ